MSCPFIPPFVCDIFTRRWYAIEFESGLVTAERRVTGVRPVEPPDAEPSPIAWIAPAFWDIQTNGRWRRSFSDSDLTVDDVIAIVRAQAELGTARLCPTLITAPFEAMRHGLATIVAACDADPVVNRMVAGIHLEGPCISDLDGYRGAHPKESIRDLSWEEFHALLDASGRRIALITLAPERREAMTLISDAIEEGIIVAIGHTAADRVTLEMAAMFGARLSTHLGNGIASDLPRHPNPIWTQAADDRLHASLIADGHHLDRSVLRVLVRAKRPERCLLVSDASPLAGLPPGVYGNWEVTASGKVVVAGTPYLAGSTRDLRYAVSEVLAAVPECTPKAALAMATTQPAEFLGFPDPGFDDYASGTFILFRLDDRRFDLIGTLVDGRWVPSGSGARPGA
ncbi:MAG TPA: amidohydrolase family protein [Isosphaeraceae bacterium]|jgi:N-acetylglucosamine-6-phosphate deacetylase